MPIEIKVVSQADFNVGRSAAVASKATPMRRRRPRRPRLPAPAASSAPPAPPQKVAQNGSAALR